MKKPLIYFLCTGNSCRSQMAEGWARQLGSGEIDVYSAGIETHGLNPRAVAATKDAGADISHHTCDLVNPEMLNNADYVIALCGDANDKCPVTPPHVRRLHWGFEDPAQATGTHEEIQAKFEEVRDAIRNQIQVFFREILP